MIGNVKANNRPTLPRRLAQKSATELSACRMPCNVRSVMFCATIILSNQRLLPDPSDRIMRGACAQLCICSLVTVRNWVVNVRERLGTFRVAQAARIVGHSAICGGQAVT